MSKQQWKPGKYGISPARCLVSCGSRDGRINVMTAAWTGTICSDPAMVLCIYSKSRYSHSIIKESGEYVINLTTEALAYATDFAGVKSGRGYG